MAKVGLEYVVAGKLADGATSGATATYTDSVYLGPSSTFNASPSVSDVKDYGDDRIVETDHSVTGGTISLELNERTMSVYAMLLGHTVSEQSGMTANVNDFPPYVGIGCIGKSISGGTKKYIVKWYYKVQFGEPSDDNSTKQDSTSFTHSTLEGTMMMLENGDWKYEKEFTSLSAAKTALNTLAGITES